MKRKQVALDEIGCCAMTHAFLRNPEMTRRWGVSCRRLSLLCEVFNLTASLMFTPDEQTVIIYRAFAAAELERLGREEKCNRLICRHHADTHRAALRTFLADLPKLN